MYGVNEEKQLFMDSSHVGSVFFWKLIRMKLLYQRKNSVSVFYLCLLPRHSKWHLFTLELDMSHYTIEMGQAISHLESKAVKV